MANLFNKLLANLKEHGLVSTLKKIAEYPRKSYKRNNFFNNVLVLKSIEGRFTEIYKENYWGNQESVSGPGSTLDYTSNLRKKIPEIINNFSIDSIFDAPCGDFNWMKYVLMETSIRYIGGDIVKDLIDKLNSTHSDSNTQFIHIDIIRSQFPECDLMLCRDCLFHLSFEDIKGVLQNFVDSKIRYLLTTTHTNSGLFQNKDIVTGDFRLIDLFSAPFHFPKDVVFRTEDWEAPDPEREMCLWTRGQIIDVLDVMSQHKFAVDE